MKNSYQILQFIKKPLLVIILKKSIWAVPRKASEQL